MADKKFSKQIGAFWLRESKAGEKYFSGVIDLGVYGEQKVAVFKNKNKEKENHPDYRMIISEPMEKVEDTPEEVTASNDAFDLY